MKHFKGLLALTLVLFAASGCSYEWREGDAQIGADEMLSYLDEANASASSSGGSVLADVYKMKDTPGVTIFYADTPRANGKSLTVSEVLAVDDLRFLDPSIADSIDDIKTVRTFFFDDPRGGNAGLIVGLAKADNAFTYYAFKGYDSVEGGEFKATVTSGAGTTVILRSRDVEGEDLNGTIQLKLFNGQDNYVGKITTLVGFGPL